MRTDSHRRHRWRGRRPRAPRPTAPSGLRLARPRAHQGLRRTTQPQPWLREPSASASTVQRLAASSASWPLPYGGHNSRVAGRGPMSDPVEGFAHAMPAAPVVWLPSDGRRAPEDGLALALSGGGTRAMMFHAGALLRLYEMGVLAELRRISGVSGGSIAAGVLAREW